MASLEEDEHNLLRLFNLCYGLIISAKWLVEKHKYIY